MNSFFTFKNLTVWQKSMDLAKEILKIFENCKNFALRDQIMRSAISIPSNIAEWFERKTSKDFQYFLIISRGSLSELETQLILANSLNCITDLKLLTFQGTIQEIAKMLWVLQKKEKNDSQRI